MMGPVQLAVGSLGVCRGATCRTSSTRIFCRYRRTLPIRGTGRAIPVSKRVRSTPRIRWSAIHSCCRCSSRSTRTRRRTRRVRATVVISTTTSSASRQSRLRRRIHIPFTFSRARISTPARFSHRVPSSPPPRPPVSVQVWAPYSRHRS